MNLREFAEYIDRLEPETEPRWGKMTAQHMVEHLTSTFKLATGEVKIPTYTPENQLAEMRKFLMSNRAIPRGVISPAVGSDLPDLHYDSLDAAVKAFWAKFDSFEAYYNENPDATNVNPAFGELKAEEWQQFMKKHLTHHFEQFGLIPA